MSGRIGQENGQVAGRVTNILTSFASSAPIQSHWERALSQVSSSRRKPARSLPHVAGQMAYANRHVNYSRSPAWVIALQGSVLYERRLLGLVAEWLRACLQSRLDVGSIPTQTSSLFIQNAS